MNASGVAKSILIWKVSKVKGIENNDERFTLTERGIRNQGAILLFEILKTDTNITNLNLAGENNLKEF